MTSLIKYYLDESLPTKTAQELRPLWYFSIDDALVVALHPIHRRHFIDSINEIYGVEPIEITKAEFEFLYTSFMLLGGYGE